MEEDQGHICGLGVITKTNNRKLMSIKENEFYRYDFHRNDLRRFANLINIEDFDNWIKQPYHNFQRTENISINYYSKEELELAKKHMPYTMTSIQRMLGTIHKVKEVNNNNISGCLVECGTRKCGILATMCLTDEIQGSNRKVYGFDSYDYTNHGSEWPQDHIVTYEEAKDILVELKADRCVLKKGYFKDSFAKIRNEIKEIAVLRIDAMLATIECLEEFYDKVSVGGYIILDDYGHYPECRKAVDEFRSSRGIEDPINYTDYTEVWWKKS